MREALKTFHAAMMKKPDPRLMLAGPCLWLLLNYAMRGLFSAPHYYFNVVIGVSGAILFVLLWLAQRRRDHAGLAPASMRKG